MRGEFGLPGVGEQEKERQQRAERDAREQARREEEAVAKEKAAEERRQQELMQKQNFINEMRAMFHEMTDRRRPQGGPAQGPVLGISTISSISGILKIFKDF